MKIRLSKIDRLKIAFGLDSYKNHSHERENARRRRQIAKGMIRITAIFFFFQARPLWPSESMLNVVSNSYQSGSYDNQQPLKIKVVTVTVEVEDVGRLWQSYTELMPVGSTTSDALSTRHKVTHGQVCLDSDGVTAVDGVGNLSEGDYWIVSVNGDYVHSNSHTQLKSGDQIKWQRLKTGT